MTLSVIAQRFLPALFYKRLTSSSIAKRLAKGSVWSVLGSGISRILVLVAMILAARILGQASFGELGLIQSTLGVFGIVAGVGLGSTATRFVAQYSVSDPSRAGRVIALVNVSSLVTVFVTSVVLIALSSVLAEAVMDAPHLAAAILWGVFVMAASAFRTIQNNVLAGLERFDIVAKLNVLEGLISLPAIVVLAKLFGVHGALFGLALSASVVWVAGRLVLTYELRSMGIFVCYQGCWADWRMLPSYSVPKFFASSLSMPVIWLAMVYVARSSEGFAGLGVYNAAYQWVGPLIFVPMVLSTVSIPVLVKEWEGGRVHRFRRLFLGLVLFASAVILGFATVVSLMSPWIMAMYGPGFKEGWSILVMLAFAAPFLGVGNMSANALFSMNKPWNEFVAMVIWSVVLLTITVSFFERWGVAALAAAFLVAHMLRAAFNCTLVLVRCSGHRSPGLCV